jgi:hypothetical protein
MTREERLAIELNDTHDGWVAKQDDEQSGYYESILLEDDSIVWRFIGERPKHRPGHPPPTR